MLLQGLLVRGAQLPVSPHHHGEEFERPLLSVTEQEGSPAETYLPSVVAGTKDP